MKRIWLYGLFWRSSRSLWQIAQCRARFEQCLRKLRNHECNKLIDGRNGAICSTYHIGFERKQSDRDWLCMWLVWLRSNKEEAIVTRLCSVATQNWRDLVRIALVPLTLGRMQMLAKKHIDDSITSAISHRKGSWRSGLKLVHCIPCEIPHEKRRKICFSRYTAQEQCYSVCDVRFQSEAICSWTDISCYGDL